MRGVECDNSWGWGAINSNATYSSEGLIELGRRRHIDCFLVELNWRLLDRLQGGALSCLLHPHFKPAVLLIAEVDRGRCYKKPLSS